METPVEAIIAKFGGLSAMARAMGHKSPTTVQGWKERGVVPARQIPLVIEAARLLDIPLSAGEFFDPPGKSAEAAPVARAG